MTDSLPSKESMEAALSSSSDVSQQAIQGEQVPDGVTSNTLDIPVDPNVTLAKENSPQPPGPNLAATFGAFNISIQQKKKVQDALEEAAIQATRQRHSLLLEAMTNIRRSLNDITQVNLGRRFTLALDVDDWQGWPRILISLMDSRDPHGDYPYFEVTANDRNAKGSIEIVFGNPQRPQCVSVTDPIEVRRLPTTLKRCTRVYLDLIGEVVLGAERATEQQEVFAKQQISRLKESEPPTITELSGDLFSDDYQPSDLLEQLPQIETLEMLPDFASSEGTGLSSQNQHSSFSMSQRKPAS